MAVLGAARAVAGSPGHIRQGATAAAADNRNLATLSMRLPPGTGPQGPSARFSRGSRSASCGALAAARYSKRVGAARRHLRAAPVIASELAADGVDHGNVVEIFSAEDFRQQLEGAGDKLVVVDVSTKWCGPCKVIYPKIVAMSKEYPDAVFLKVFGDHDVNTKALMKEWKVRAVPNFRFFRGGELVHSHNGAKEEDLRKHFLKHYSEEAVTV